MKYTLQVKEGKKGMKTYTVVDETGKVISTRKSERTYVAALINGGAYFGRLDLLESYARTMEKKYGQVIGPVAFVEK